MIFPIFFFCIIQNSNTIIITFCILRYIPFNIFFQRLKNITFVDIMLNSLAFYGYIIFWKIEVQLLITIPFYYYKYNPNKKSSDISTTTFSSFLPFYLLSVSFAISRQLHRHDMVLVCRSIVDIHLHHFYSVHIFHRMLW